MRTVDNVTLARCGGGPQTVSTLNKSSFVNGFPMRLDGKFHPIEPTITCKKPCQFCHYKRTESNPGLYTKGVGDAKPFARLSNNCLKVMLCLRCNVRLCPSCYNEFHGFKGGV